MSERLFSKKDTNAMKGYSKFFQRFPDRKMRILFSVLAIFFSIMLVFSGSFEKSDSLYPIFGNAKNIMISVLKMLGWFVLLYEGCRLAVTLHPGTAIRKRSSKMADSLWGKAVPALFIIIFICWVPYYIISFPGNMTPDSQDELAQIFQDKENSWTYNSVIHENPEDNAINNHHPVFYTCFLGAFVYLGRCVGDINMGIALFSFVQMLLTIGGIVHFLIFLKKKKIPMLYLYFVLAFFSLYPIFPMYAVTVSKDMLFAVALLWGSVELCILLDEQKQNWNGRLHAGLYILSLTFMCLLRSNGAYIIISLLPFAVAAAKRMRKRMLLCTLVPLVFYFFIFSQIILPAFEIRAGANPREMLSVPLQQIARYAAAYGKDGFEEGELTKLNRVMHFAEDTSILARRYHPTLSDQVKQCFDKNPTEEDVENFLKIWLKLVARHPGTCMAATLNNNYLLTNATGGRKPFLIYVNKTKTYREEKDWYGVKENRLFSSFREKLSDVLVKWSRIPGVGVPFTIGWYDFLILFCLVFCISRGKYKEAVCILPMLFCIGTTALGPIIYMRYAVQWIFMVPMAGAMLLD